MPTNEVIRLWPDGPPTTLEGVGLEVEYRAPVGVAAQATMLRNVSEPTLTVFRPEKPNGVGIVVCPGGGWRLLAWEHEGLDVARWLNAKGYTVFLLKYRVRGTPDSQAEYEAQLGKMMSSVDISRRGKTAFRAMSDIVPPESIRDARAAAADDGRRAVAIVRERAKEWDVDPAKIGMMGFSAGAFLVVDVAMEPRAAPLAFVAAIYGGETLGRPVPKDAPPLFTCIAQDDFLLYRVVEGLYADWSDADRSAELHIYRRGNHGFGMVKQGSPSDRWIEQCHEWLVDLGLA
ncbi:MAG: alpha/beta hydrolase fold domain-containing protein [Proteobacteria bacterium]|nr:alpha/beta hydrolase fold domain-containing protein [Pseudomonadota bacterium]